MQTLDKITARARELKDKLILQNARKKAITLVQASQAKAEASMGLTKAERDALWHSNYAPSAMAKTPITPAQVAKVAPKAAAPTPKPKPTPTPEKRSDDKDGFEVFPRSPKYRLTRADFNELTAADKQRFLAAKGTLTA